MNEKGWDKIFVLPAEFSVRFLCLDQVLEGIYLEFRWTTVSILCINMVMGMGVCLEVVLWSKQTGKEVSMVPQPKRWPYPGVHVILIELASALFVLLVRS